MLKQFFTYLEVLRKESVHSHWVPKEAIDGVREFYDEEQGLVITHYLQKFPSPIESDTKDSNKENVPPEHSYKETSIEREIFEVSGTSDDSEVDPNRAADTTADIREWRNNVSKAGSPEIPSYIPRRPSPMEGVRVPHDQAVPGHLSQSFCDTLPNYPEGHIITVHQKWMHVMTNQMGATHGPYCICRNKENYLG